MKILVSSGFGAGWSTWAHAKKKEVAEYGPIIDFLENGGDSSSLESDDPPHPLVDEMMSDLGLDYFYSGGAKGLTVREVSGPYRIEEYDGHETVHTKDEEEYW